jgi:hypothetical protein
MNNSGETKPRPGDRVVLVELPPGLLDDLPAEDQQAISEAVGKAIQLNAYEDDGRAELEFKDRNGVFHYIYVKPEFIRALNRSDQTFDALQKLIKKSDIVSLRRELHSRVSPSLSNQFSWTLLMLAAVDGKLSIGELLVSRGAEVNATNDFGDTALSLAAQRGHIRFVGFLVSHGASGDCHPHGHSLGDWLRASSGLPQHKLASILHLINAAKS